MRRHARRMRRYGLQPMGVINDGGQLPDLVVVLIGRWLWRYRSELTPLYLTLSALAAGWLLHATHPHVWPYVLALATVTGSALTGLGHRGGLTRLSERLYAAAVGMAGGSWC